MRQTQEHMAASFEGQRPDVRTLARGKWATERDGCERTPLLSDTLAGVRCSRRHSGTSKGALLALSAGVVYADSVPEVSRRSQPMCGGVVFEEHA